MTLARPRSSRKLRSTRSVVRMLSRWTEGRLGAGKGGLQALGKALHGRGAVTREPLECDPAVVFPASHEGASRAASSQGLRTARAWTGASSKTSLILRGKQCIRSAFRPMASAPW